jgi:hypothetical protein
MDKGLQAAAERYDFTVPNAPETVKAQAEKPAFPQLDQLPVARQPVALRPQVPYRRSR